MKLLKIIAIATVVVMAVVGFDQADFSVVETGSAFTKIEFNGNTIQVENKTGIGFKENEDFSLNKFEDVEGNVYIFDLENVSYTKELIAG